MKGSESKMKDFMEGNDKRFIIPVYQRKYDWKYENCKQLYEDLKKIITDNRESHFFGSIVSAVVPNGSKIEYHIIDGQQRLTTITLLLLALSNLIEEGKITCTKDKLSQEILDRFIISPYADENDKIKLHPVKSDRDALKRLFGDKEDYDFSSNLTINYQYFYDLISQDTISATDLFDAIGKLEIIAITLEQNDNAQLIFESLNSTGLALTEGDKIRNYVLMSLPPKEQPLYFDKYWSKIEKCTKNDVSAFIRDYLTVKRQLTPNINNVYQEFKSYSQALTLTNDELLDDILNYARLYEKLLTSKSGLNNSYLDNCMYRLNRLEMVVPRPFLLEVLKLNQDGKIPTSDVAEIFTVVENYLFRRNICDVPTNALNKVFKNLNKEIIRYDNSADNYLSKFIYALTTKKDTARYPMDDEFKEAISQKQVYKMRGTFKAYLFERYENYGTVEAKDVYSNLDKNVYTIEHIMPQTLTPSWMDSLGERADEIHDTWLHRLANLTLTGYNSNLSNNTFIEKREGKGGYKDSGLRMNQKIATKDSWGVNELEERNDDMVKRALEIWSYPTTEFVPVEKEFESCSLDDENYDLKGREIVKYSYLDIEQPVTSWAEMFENIVKYLHERDKSVLNSLVFQETDDCDSKAYFSNDESLLRTALKIDNNIYVEKNTSTTTKIRILRRLFTLFNLDPMDLIFYLKEEKNVRSSNDLDEIRKKYWAYVIPCLQNKTMHRGTFNNASVTTSNTLSGSFGMSGFAINCIANIDCVRVELCISTSDKEKNESAFDKLYSHKIEIENQLGTQLKWDRADKYKACYISYSINQVGVNNENDWPKMKQFHCEWADKLLEAMINYLMNPKEKRYSDIAGAFREWALTKENIHLDIKRSARSFTRFTTDGMNEIIPEIPGCPSGWNSENHYFYEIVNIEKQPSYIKLVLSNKNSTDEFKQICDRIDKIYPTGNQKDDWLWRQIFKSETINIGDEINKDEIFKFLDSCMEEILKFEKNLKNKLNETV